ncbi:hypothetical protein A8C32_05135 [Flavivirga aquatica]|uniref:Uncharacterized protein n=1 Tax=Flavivirga aquatica TaxID=1849968 RepID=A0A1E5SHP0_9FLAO|nr:contractile injection system tape measure protein [Flavivirga aquatica]OEJ98586.1 hypothetical protein A8C32_05135 [Flavivirga aquatica]
MKDDQTHIIKSQQYEIELEDASQGYTYQSRVSQIQEHSIQNILQKVMDIYHVPEYLDQYNDIVLDLGTISASNFDRELGYKIEEAFINFFKNNTYDNGSLIKGKRKPIYKKQIDQFVFFLKNGYLQWDTPSSTKPIELLESALRNNKEELVAILKKEGQKESIRKRLISQLQDTALEKIVIAIKDDAGVYINQSRRDIVQYQENYGIIEINKAYFRNAIWEITLAYIFTEITGYSNQASFLKYLIHKIAVKYNLTYKDLLKKIVLGVKQSKERISAIPNFGKIVILLQEEVDRRESAINDITKPNNDLNIIEVFRYYIEHQSLPAESRMATFNIFSKNVEAILEEEPAKFYAVFYELIKDSFHVNQLTNHFSEPLINKIVIHANHVVLAVMVRFFSQMVTLSNKLSIKSATLERLKQQLGEIVLNTYVAINKRKAHTIVVFLHQIIKEIAIDKAFVLILEAFKDEKGFKYRKEILAFVKDIKVAKSKKREDVEYTYNTIFFKFSKKLYSYYKGKAILSLKEFQTHLAENNYNEASYKLTIVLLEIYAKDKNCTKQELSQWIEERLVELGSKGENVEVVLSQMYHISQVLYLDAKIIEVLKAIKISDLKRHQEKPSVLKHIKRTANQIPEKIYQEFIETIKEKLFNRRKQDLHDSIQELLELFSVKHEIEKSLLLAALKKENIAKHIPEFIKSILDQLAENPHKVSNKRRNNDRYNLDVTQYFLNTGKLPWWTRDKLFVSFQESIYYVLNQYPERFVSWFKKSKHQKVIVDLMDDNMYNVFIKQVNSSVTQSVLATKQLFFTLLDKDLYGVKNILPTHYKTVEYLFLEYIHANKHVEVSKITAFIIDKLAEMLSVTKEDLYQLLLGRIRYDKQVYNNSKNLESWLLTVVEQPKAVYKDLIQSIESEKVWKDAISMSLTKELINNLETIYKNRSQELMFHIKQASFRKQLISKLNTNAQKEVVSLFLSASERSQLLTIFEIFKKFRKQITIKNYQVVWNHFIDKLLLKIAISQTANWSIRDWSLLLFESIISIKHSNALPQLISEAVVYNNTTSEHIVNEMQFFLDKKEEYIKKENKEIVPEVIEEETIGESAFIENAGMVILGPYIYMLFERLGLLENGVFKNEESQHKAIYILQYATTGKTDAEEHELLLNKIICGLDIHEPIPHAMSLSLEEKEMIDNGLLKAIIAHWSAIGNTSVEGLRVSFLCRPGRITVEEKKYVLVVEEKSYDMLLDNIPWTIGQLKLSWMQKLLEVIWRS